MTHFLRSRHDAILVGVGTVIADDPGLNCRLASSAKQRTHQPRPVILDPRARWDVRGDSRVLTLAREGVGLAPWVLTAVDEAHLDPARRERLGNAGGRYVFLQGTGELGRFGWADILRLLRREGLESVMIEGGGQVITSLLEVPNNKLVDSVIVTIAPTWLGQGSVLVSPRRVTDGQGRPKAAARLTEVSWHPLGEDVVLCGELLPSSDDAMR
jgi:2,5-diamino-6-(ribosylamino)-4(3H)-pyrimidinone 5'-phosphate reductase